jgi:hypothetical protein
MERFVTYEKEFGVISCMSEDQFSDFKQSDRADECNDWHEYVWQFAPDKQAAISQHYEKHDEWQENPNKDTY